MIYRKNILLKGDDMVICPKCGHIMVYRAGRMVCIHCGYYL